MSNRAKNPAILFHSSPYLALINLTILPGQMDRILQLPKELEVHGSAFGSPYQISSEI